MGKKLRAIFGSFTIILMIAASVFIYPTVDAKPNKTRIAGNWSRTCYVNTRYAIWKESVKSGDSTIRLYDLETKKHATLANGVLMEMKDENCIYQGTSNVCWINVTVPGSRGWNLQGIASDFKTIYTITSNGVMDKCANIDGTVVTFYCLDAPGGIFYFNFEKPENGKILIRETVQDNFKNNCIPRISNNKIIYGTTDEEKISHIYIFDVDKGTETEIATSTGKSELKEPVITKNYAFYIKSENLVNQICCYNLSTCQTTFSNSSFNGETYCANNPNTDLLFYRLATHFNNNPRQNLYVFDPKNNQTLEISNKNEQEGNAFPTYWINSNSCFGRKIVYLKVFKGKNELILATVGNDLKMTRTVIDTLDTKRPWDSNPRIYCDNLVWSEFIGTDPVQSNVYHLKLED